MPTTFKWTGKTPKGTVQQGELTADTREDVISALRKQGIIPTIIAEKKAMSMKFGGSSRGPKIKDRDIIVFTRQFASMYNAGIPIVQALDIMSKQTENKSLRGIVGQVKSDVESGITLADAMKKYPKAFDDLYVNLVAAGETGGVLDSVLHGNFEQYTPRNILYVGRQRGERRIGLDLPTHGRRRGLEPAVRRARS